MNRKSTLFLFSLLTVFSFLVMAYIFINHDLSISNHFLTFVFFAFMTYFGYDYMQKVYHNLQEECINQ